MKRKQKRYAWVLIRENDMSETGKFKLAESKKFRRCAARIEDVRLPKLKNLLAAFRTQTFSFTDDKAVVMQ